MSLEQIATKYGVLREDVGFLRQLYNIKRKGAAYQHRKATEVPLTARQRDLVYGSLMGDAKKVSDTAVGFGHGERQREYLMWKFSEMYSVISKTSLKATPYTDKRTGYKGVSWRCYTHANSDLEVINYQFYCTGNKEITLEILENLSPFSVAVWYMDDGKIDWHFRIKRYDPKCNITPVITLCTESFSRQSCENIQKWFYEKYQIKVRLKAHKLKNRIGYRVIVASGYAAKFLDLVRPHILPEFAYKIDYEEYVARRLNIIV
jgi:hypothetical protein